MTSRPARIKELDLHTAQGAAGELVRESQFVTRYSREASTNPSRALSLTMPVRATPYTANRIPPILAMNLPEGYLLDLVTSRYQKVMDVRDEMNLLALTSTPTSGRVWARMRDQEQKSPEASVTLKEILSAKGTEELFDELVEKFALSTSLAGVMPKVAVVERAQLHTRDLIVKSGAAEYPGLAENEYLCMSIAKAAGLEVPEFWLSDDRKLFVVRRFDVAVDGTHLGFEDMACLTGRMPDEKYRGNYANIALAIQDRVPSAGQAASLRRYFRQLVLCVILRNGDAHLKNWGILYRDPVTAREDARLSPAYDIVCTTPYIKGDVLALGLQGSKAWPDRKTLEAFARDRCGLTNPGAMIDELLDVALHFRPQEDSPVWQQVRAALKGACSTLR